MKISVLVPVYREPKYLEDIARKICDDVHPDKELVVVIDGAMTPEIKAAVDALEGRVTVVFPDLHRGKAAALNAAAADLETDVLLFLDNDILLPERTDFLAGVARHMDGREIVDLPKEVIVQSFFSSMISYEYQSLAISSFVFAKLTRRSPGLIGAAFAVRKTLFERLGGFRLVVHEDGDFGARAFRLRAKYEYALDLKVRTSMPNDLRSWFTQRKRWTLINVLWFKENFLYLLKSVFRQPSLIPTLLFHIIPPLASIVAYVLLAALNMRFVHPLLFMLEQPFQLIAGVLFWLGHQTLVSQGLISTAVGFAVAASTFISFSVFARFRFNILSFLVYYFLYLPVVIVINVGMFIILLGQPRIKLDWKV